MVKNIRFLCIILLVISGIGRSQQAQLHFSPATTTVSQFDTFTVQGVIQDVADLHAYDVIVSFPNAYVECLSAETAYFLGFLTFFYPIIRNDLGEVQVTEALLGVGGVSGSGALFNLKFRALADGAGDLLYDYFVLRDSQNQNIPVTVFPGQVIVGASQPVEFGKTVREGWNLLSLPLEISNPHYAAVFPPAMPGTLYGFNGSYFSLDTLELFAGYWLRFAEADTFAITGQKRTSATIPLEEGWNLIGSLSGDVAVNDIDDPNGVIIPGTLYGYENTYLPADTIYQGNGYWLRASAAGQIALSASPNLPRRPPRRLSSPGAEDPARAIRISDSRGASQALYLDIAAADPAISESYTLPPLPPGGAFDARFAGDRRATAETEAIVQVQALHYPLTISMAGSAPAPDFYYTVTPLPGGSEPADSWMLTAERPLRIFDRNLRAFHIKKTASWPETFTVFQNYPNPFNPRTVIRYYIPEPGAVKVSIYNTLGQEVITLVDEKQPAGYHEAVWNAADAPGRAAASGFYFYVVKTARFSETRKMVLLR